jgi:hypothetical protein
MTTEEVKTKLELDIKADSEYIQHLQSKVVTQDNPILKKALQTQINLLSFGKSKLEALLKLI